MYLQELLPITVVVLNHKSLVVNYMKAVAGMPDSGQNLLLFVGNAMHENFEPVL